MKLEKECVVNFMYNLMDIFYFILVAFNLPLLLAHSFLKKIIGFKIEINEPYDPNGFKLMLVCALFSSCFYYTLIKIIQ